MRADRGHAVRGVGEIRAYRSDTPMTVTRRKLIEVALPLDAINDASRREKSIRHGHPSTLHLWWARRPLAAARAVIFAQMVDDPSSDPAGFPAKEDQQRERERLFRILERLVRWENTTNEDVLAEAREEILQSWRRACADNKRHSRVLELFDPDRPPAFHDPFAGGGALPLEAQRLGLEAHASDLNPVAVLINKAMIEIPPRFSGQSPVNPQARSGGELVERQWNGARGLAEDVRYYGNWMRDEAQRRIGHLYPEVAVTPEMVETRPDLKPYLGRKLTVIAWLWARTVRSPNPAFADVNVPLVSTWMLSTKKGKQAYVEPVIEGREYWFRVRAGIPADPQAARAGTSAGRRKAFRCLMSDAPIPYDYIRREGRAGRMGTRLMAVVAEGDRTRIYVAPPMRHEVVGSEATPPWKPDAALPNNPRDFKTPNYGLRTFGDLFTPRQLVALTTFSDLVGQAVEQIREDAVEAGLPNDDRPLRDGGTGAEAYAEAVGVYLALGVSRSASMWSSNCWWQSNGAFVAQVFTRQAIPMVWDFAETNVFSASTGNWESAIAWITGSLNKLAQLVLPGAVTQEAAQRQKRSGARSHNNVVSTDPPYYDNIGYADLSDFYYVWQRRILRPVFPELFGTLAVPKAEELVASPYRHGTKAAAEAYFLEGMERALTHLSAETHPGFPVTVYYAFKQSETKGDASSSVSTGWETFLDAVIRSDFAITGTWPIRTERPTGVKVAVNALASSIVLVCRRRPTDAPLATRREFLTALRSELPSALAVMRSGNIAPVDLAQAAIGPGMAIYTRYAWFRRDANTRPNESLRRSTSSSWLRAA